MATKQQQTPKPPSSSTINNKDMDGSSSSPPPTPSTTSQLTTYVQADPSTFRDLVQKLTGKTVGPSPPRKAPPPPPPPPSSSSCFKKQKLQERRHAPTKLEIKLGPSSARFLHHRHVSSTKGQDVVMVSPVSTMDSFFLSSPSPATTPTTAAEEEEEEEKRAIAEKGFYLHSSPRNRDPPLLLPLFPLHSPRDRS